MGFHMLPQKKIIEARSLLRFDDKKSSLMGRNSLQDGHRSGSAAAKPLKNRQKRSRLRARYLLL
jgi:hypothetical protein